MIKKLQSSTTLGRTQAAMRCLGIALSPIACRLLAVLLLPLFLFVLLIHGAQASYLPVTSGGNIGIGTTTASEKLEVIGTVKATRFIGDGSGLTGINASQWITTGSDIYYTVGNVGIGTTAPRSTSKLDIQGGAAAPSKIVNVNGTFTDLAGTRTGSYVDVTANTAGAGLAAGSWSEVRTTANAGTYTNATTGSYSEALHSGNATADFMIGALTLANQTGAGPVTNAYGIYPQVWKGAGTITNAFGLYYEGVPNANGDTSDTSGTVINQYGIALKHLTQGTTRNIGIFLDDNVAGPSATGNFGIYEEAGDANYFAGNIGIGSTSPGAQLALFSSGGANVVDTHVNADNTGTYASESRYYAGTEGGGRPASSDVQTYRFFAGSGAFQEVVKVAVNMPTITTGTVIGAMDFYTQSTGGLLKRMTLNDAGAIFQNGNIGVSSSAPSQKVDVIGTVKATAFIGDGSGLSNISGSVSGLNTGYLPKASSSTTINDSAIYQNGANIGIGTTGPTEPLTVGTYGASNRNPILVEGGWTGPTSPGNNSPGDRLIFYEDGSWKTALGFGSSNELWLQANTGTGTDRAFSFYTGVGFGAAISEKMTIIGNGNVGIGTVVPQAKLDVEGSVYVGNGNVGIGTTAPTEKLSVFNGNIRVDNANTAAISLYPTEGGGYKAEMKVNYNGAHNFELNNVYGEILGGYNHDTALMMGNVGIGSTVPQQKLDVIGTVKATAFIGDGSGLSNISGSVSGLNTGYIPKASSATTINDSAIYQNGSNIGIGTTVPASKLDVAGAVHIIGNLSFSGAGTATVYSDNSQWAMYINGGYPAQYITTKGLFVQGLVNNVAQIIQSSNDIADLTQWKNSAGNSLVVIDKTGNIGIGSTVPQVTLDVEGSAYFGNGNVGIGTAYTGNKLTVFSSAADANTYVASFNNSYSAGSGVSIQTADNNNVRIVLAARSQNGAIDGLTVTNAGNVNLAGTALYAQYNGNVGIGTTNPQYNLSFGSANATSTISIERPGTDAATGKNLVIQAGGVTTGAKYYTKGGDLFLASGITSEGTPTAIYFQTAGEYLGNPAGTVTPTSKMVIKDGGSNTSPGDILVGIGTTNPSGILHVEAYTNTNSPVQFNPVIGAYLSDGAATIKNGVSINVTANTSPWNFAELTALKVQGSANYGVTDAYGLKVSAPTGGGITNSYSAVFTGGNVGIGSTAPQAKLDVEGSAYFGNGNIGVGSSVPSQKVDVLGTVKATAFIGDGSGLSNISGSISGLNTGYLPKASSSTTINDSAIYQNGSNIGIGTTAPVARLHVRPQSNSTIGLILQQSGSAQSANLMEVRDYNGVLLSWIEPSAGTFVGPVQGNVKLGGGGQVYYDSSNYIKENTGHGWEIKSWSYNEFDGASYFSGNVGISSSAPQAKLDVEGNVYVGDGGAGSGGNMGIGSVIPTQKLDVLGTVKATAFIGDGSGLSNISGSVSGLNTGYISKSSSATTINDSAIYQNGTNIGIGSTAPLAKLELVGTGTTSATTSLTVRASDGTSRVTVLDNGNVGIGVASPKTTLDVNGDLTFYNDSHINIQANPSSENLVLTAHRGVQLSSWSSAVGAGNASFFMRNTDFSFQSAGVTKVILKYDPASTNLNVGIGSSVPQATLDLEGSAYFGNGNIGVGSSAPSQKVDVLGTVKATAFIGDGSGLSNISGSVSGLNTGYIPKASSSTTINDSAIYQNGSNIGIGTTAPVAILDLVGSGTTSATSSLILRNSAGTANMTVLDNGNVGIGITNPHQTFQIDMNSATANGIYIVNKHLTAGDVTKIAFDTAAGCDGNGACGANYTSINVNTISTTASHRKEALSFSTFNQEADGTQERLRINYNGNVGIGSTAPQATLDVEGSAYFGNGNIGVGSSIPSQKVDVLGTVKATAFIGDGSGLTGLPASGGWTRTGTNVYVTTSTDNVGIGSSVPRAKLEVAGGAYFQGGNVGIGTSVTGAALSFPDVTGIATGIAFGSDMRLFRGNTNTLNIVSATGAPVLWLQPAAGGYGAYLDFAAAAGSANFIRQQGGDALHINGNGINTFTIMNSGNANVGIGSTVPQAKLDVEGSAYFGNGNVGVGTTATADAKLTVRSASAADVLLELGSNTTAPYQAQQVYFNASDSASSGMTIINDWGGSSGAFLSLSHIGSTFNGVGIYANMGTGGGTFGGNFIRFQKAGVTQFNIDNAGSVYASGNVGIGTTAPVAKLDVTGTGGGVNWLRIGDVTYSLVSVDNWGTTTFGRNVIINPTVGSAYSDVTDRSLQIIGKSGQTGNILELNSYGTGSGYRGDLLVVKPNGNVGIGSTTPQAKLDVEGSAYFGNGNIGVGSSAPSQKVDVLGTVKATAFIGDGSGLTGLPAGGGWTASGTNVYTTTSSNNVGIGTTAPQARLDVEGGVYFGNGNVGIGSTSSDAIMNVERAGSAAASAVRGYYSASGFWAYGLLGNVNGLYGVGVQGESSAGYGVAGYGDNGVIGQGSSTGVMAANYSDTGKSLWVTQGLNGYAIYSEGGKNYFNANVGINSNAPQAKLDVEGGAYFGNGNIGVGSSAPSQKVDVLGTVKATAFIGDGSGITGITGTSQWTTNGTSIYYNTGNVGIGTTNPGSTFDVQGGTATGSSAGANIVLTAQNGGSGSAAGGSINLTAGGGDNGAGAYIVLGGSSWGGGYSKLVGAASDVNGTPGYVEILGGPGRNLSGANVYIAGGNGTSGSYTMGNVVLGLNASGQARGNVGINSSAPQAKLDVEGSAYFGNGNIGVGTSAPNAKMELVGSGTTNATTSLVIRDSTKAATVTVLDNGSVGIGTTAPGQILDVFNSAVGGVVATFRGAANTYNSQIYFQYDSNRYGWTFNDNSTDRYTIKYEPNGPRLSFVAGGLYGTTRMAIDSNGNVGIGTWSPMATLEVQKNSTYPSLMVSSDGSTDGDYLIVTSNGNVGIGSSAPQAKLDVEGSVYFGNGNIGVGSSVPSQKVDVLGTVKATAFIGDGSGLTGLPAGGGWTASGTNVYTTTSSNNVGIGTTGPQHKLHLHESAASTAVYMQFTAAATGNTATDGTLFGIGYIGNTYIWNYEAALIAFGTNNTQRMQIDSLGNVGIGTSTPGGRLIVYDGNVGIGSIAPGARLDLVGAGTTSATQALQIHASDGTSRVTVLDNGNVGISIVNPGQRLEVDGSILSNAGGGGSVCVADCSYGMRYSGGLELTASNGSGSYMTFNTGASDDERMRITGPGNVGIGTTSPGSLLSVNGGVSIGSAYASAAAAPANGLIVAGNVGIGSTVPQAMLDVEGSAYFGNGNIGVGSSEPSQKVDVLGTVKATAFIGDGSGLTGLPSGGGWTASGTNVYTTTSSNNVGIGTSVPLSKLDLVGTGTTSATASLIIRDSALAPKVTVLDNGNVGIGVTAPQAKVSVTGTSTDALTNYGMTINHTSRPSADNAYGRALSVYETSAGSAHSFTELSGINIQGATGGSGAIASLYGINNYFSHSGSSSIVTNWYGLANDLYMSSQNTVNNTYGTYTTFRPRFGGSVMTNAYGNYVTAQPADGGTITNAYGLYVDDLAAQAGTAYGVYTVGNAKNYFGGNVGVGSSVPSQKVDVIGTVKATAFIGDGSGLTGLPSGGGWTRTGTNVYVTTSTDNVGIGSSAPASNFNINASNTTTNVAQIDAASLTSGQALAINGPSGGTAGVTSPLVAFVSNMGITSSTSGMIRSDATVNSSTNSQTNHVYVRTTNAPTVQNQIYGINNYLTDGTALGNQVTGIMSQLSLSGNASKEAYGISSSVNTNSTTADTSYGGYFNMNITGAVTAGTQATYGIYSTASSRFVNGGTANVYGVYSQAGGTVSSGTINVYGFYAGNGSTSGVGTSTKYGLYIAPQTGSVYNYGAYIGSNVGISSSAPTQALDVLGTVKATAFIGDGSGLTGITGASSQWTTNGTAIYYNTGNVGIGTSAPTDTLDIRVSNSKDGLRIIDTGTGDGIQFQGYYASINFNTYWDGSNMRAIGPDYTGSITLDPDSGMMMFATGNKPGAGAIATTTDRLYLTNAGDLGIGVPWPGPTTSRLEVRGTTADNTAAGLNVTDSTGASTFYVRNDGHIGIGTTSPAGILDVEGGTAAASQNGSSIKIVAQNGGTGSTNGGNIYLTVGSGDGGIGDVIVGGWGNLVLPAGSSVNWGGGYASILGDGSGNLTLAAGQTNQNITLTPSGAGYTILNGNVGIGTTSPTTKLQIAGDVANFPMGDIYSQLEITGSTNSAKRLSLGYNTTADMGFIQSVRSNWDYMPLVINPNGGNVGIGYTNPGTAKLAINGNVGIGTTNPGGTLDVEGGTAASGDGSNITLAAQNGQQSGNTYGGNIILTPGVGYGGYGPGYVGIGTTAPHRKLEIYGTPGTGGATIRLTDGTPQGPTTNNSWDIQSVYNYTNPDLVFSTVQAATWWQSSEKFRINANGQMCLGYDGAGGCTGGGGLLVNGNVGIGTSGPNAKLDVVSGQFRVKRYSATVSVDWNNGNVQSLTLESGTNTITFANGKDGSRYTLILKQPPSGAAGLVSWPAEARWSAASPPALTVTNGKTDYVGFIYNGVDSTYDGVAVVLNF